MSDIESDANPPVLTQLFRSLPEASFREAAPDPAPAPYRIAANQALAAEMGLPEDWLMSDDALDRFSGRKAFDKAPVAFAYAGHQFGQFNPQLGDGRALLLGEWVSPAQQVYEWQLKGSGRTDFSRGGDGKSPIGPVLREYILCEAMHALGVPTTRALYALGTGETVYRERALDGAVLCRVGQSFIRIGSMQFFAARGDHETLMALVTATQARSFPESTDDNGAHAEQARPALRLLNAVIDVQAKLIAKWQALGFIHGVMNTDNMLLCGETIDYGPCAFMEAYDPATVFSSIDHQGRYAYGNQPGIAHWNLAQLAQALIPLIDEDSETAVALAQESVNRFPQLFLDAYHEQFAHKLGLACCRDESDQKLIADYLDLLKAEGLDFTNSFRSLASLLDAADDSESSAEMFAWRQRWQQRCLEEQEALETIKQRMNASNPAFIPRNHLVQAAIEEAETEKQFSLFEALLSASKNPYASNHESKLTRPATPEQQVRQTFCGT